eukprot:CAMPEP_0204406366 /NCGR_PEP_ID=MMETSP0470-20130426/8006_1 /ASSEMBLY_ACC=CAM_ASM_000385 /TAXON_ID=2969 /ORGANISM="Oxyrrhis marina" /LENGTH=36 /DNA_ID= /DNA_START= /DNA_END= /DNA_ORIENTATION=
MPSNCFTQALAVASAVGGSGPSNAPGPSGIGDPGTA